MFMLQPYRPTVRRTLVRVIQMAGEKETLVTFVIGRVAMHDFHSYHFHAVNGVGQTSHAVRLIRRHRRPPTSTGMKRSEFQ